jgi:hypothetical protein
MGHKRHIAMVRVFIFDSYPCSVEEAIHDSDHLTSLKAARACAFQWVKPGPNMSRCATPCYAKKA